MIGVILTTLPMRTRLRRRIEKPFATSVTDFFVSSFSISLICYHRNDLEFIVQYKLLTNMECRPFWDKMISHGNIMKYNTVRVKLLTGYSSVLQIGWERGKSYSDLPNCPLHPEYGYQRKAPDMEHWTQVVKWFGS